jgi:ABC-type sugar transport system substrate-binding protein
VRKYLCIAMGALALGATACGGDDEQQSGSAGGEAKQAAPVARSLTAEQLTQRLGPVPQAPEGLRVGVIEKTLINEHWQEMKRGYEDAAKKYGVEVTVQAARDETDLTGQLAIADTMIQQGYDVFAVSPLSPSNLGPFLEKAKAQNIPVINVDDARVESRVFVGSNHEEMGREAARYFAEQLPKGSEVAQVEGQAGSPAAIQRTRGFQEEAQKLGLRVVASVPGDWDRQKSLDVARSILRSNPQVKAIYANNDTMALGVLEAVRAAGRDVMVIGTDGVPDAVERIRSGQLTGTIASFPYTMGYTAVEAAIRLQSGQGVPNVINSRQELVTKANVDQAFAE